ncbi:MAG: SAM-dependent methyltransferase [Bacteroidota bacterium]
MNEVKVSRRRVLVAAAAAAAAAATSLPTLVRAQQNAGPYVPTPWKIVDDMLRLAQVRKDDFVMDLGSGDGRLVITAAERFGARGYGVDIDPTLVKLANENAAKAGVADRVKFEKRDLFETNLTDATVLTLYLLPHTVTQLVPRIFADMRPGSRVVSHDYPLGPWQPERHLQFDVPEKVEISGTTRTVLYLYIVPARVGGAWRLELPAALTKQPTRLAFDQQPAGTKGSATIGNRQVALEGVRISGETVRFAIPGIAAGGKPLALEGVARGDVIEGTVTAPGGPAPWRATRL